MLPANCCAAIGRCPAGSETKEVDTAAAGLPLAFGGDASAELTCTPGAQGRTGDVTAQRD